MTTKIDYTREELIAICERAVVPMHKWRDRDSPHSQEKLGLCWVMLKAGAEFHVHPAAPLKPAGCYTDDHTIWLTLSWHDFSDFEYGTRLSAGETFYLPTPARLDKTTGEDWY